MGWWASSRIGTKALPESTTTTQHQAQHEQRPESVTVNKMGRMCKPASKLPLFLPGRRDRLLNQAASLTGIGFACPGKVSRGAKTEPGQPGQACIILHVKSAKSLLALVLQTARPIFELLNR